MLVYESPTYLVMISLIAVAAIQHRPDGSGMVAWLELVGAIPCGCPARSDGKPP